MLTKTLDTLKLDAVMRADIQHAVRGTVFIGKSKEDARRIANKILADRLDAGPSAVWRKIIMDSSVLSSKYSIPSKYLIAGIVHTLNDDSIPPEDALADVHGDAHSAMKTINPIAQSVASVNYPKTSSCEQMLAFDLFNMIDAVCDIIADVKKLVNSILNHPSYAESK